MGEIVNLRRVKRRLHRASEAEDAAAARAKHGRSGAERALAERVAAAQDRVLDGARLEPDHDGAAKRAKDTASTS